ncbi:hypothetical protein ACWENR_10925 [Micromonospora sp. NPDC004336]
MTRPVLDAVASFYRGRRTVLVGRPLVAYGATVATLRSWGAEPPLVVADGRGQGNPPSGIDGVYLVDLGAREPGALAAATQRLLDAPPEALVARLDRYDPEHRALLLCDSNITGTEFAGRVLADGRSVCCAQWDRPARWSKFCAEVGLAQPRSALVPAAESPAGVGDGLDLGFGVLCQLEPDADNSYPADATYLARTARDWQTIADVAAVGRSEVRLTPVLPGIHCGVPGFVLADGVVTLAPVAEIWLRDPSTARLRWAGCSTYLEVDPVAAQSARAVADRIGQYLRDRCGYRGAFHVTGVLAGRSFTPGGLTARLHAGHRLLSDMTPDLPWGLLHAAIRSAPESMVTSAQLQEELDAAVAGARRADIMLTTPVAGAAAGRTRWLTATPDGRPELAAGTDDSAACLVYGDYLGQGLVMLVPSPGLGVRGSTLTSFVARAFAISDDLWATGLADLEPV